MSIRKDKERIIISLPINQIKWLESMSKRAGISKSKFISWYLARKAYELYQVLKLNENKPSDEEMEEILDIVKTKWID